MGYVRDKHHNEVKCLCEKEACGCDGHCTFTTDEYVYLCDLHLSAGKLKVELASSESNLEKVKQVMDAAMEQSCRQFAKMQTELDQLRRLVRELADGLIWMSGSSDFAPEGKAHKGFVDTIRPLLDRASGL